MLPKVAAEFRRTNGVCTLIGDFVSNNCSTHGESEFHLVKKVKQRIHDHNKVHIATEE